MGEESMNLNETEMILTHMKTQLMMETMMNKIIAPTCSEKTIKRVSQKKQDVNSQKFKQLFQAISDMF